MDDKREFHTLDGLRGVAALVVVILHAQTYDFLSFGPKSGALAVDLFFCLSGFGSSMSMARASEMV
jgi:peptidoglycan/LPS O-acetylase OafA/YrhL